VLEIDGSYGEGGGQLVRMAVALSALTSTPFRVVKVRAKRKPPGLAAQHVTAIRAVATMCDARIEGVEMASQAFTFEPGDLHGGKYSFDIGTAGSITLVLQACLPAAFRTGDTELEIRRATDVPWSPPLDYFGHVFLGLLRKMGGRADVEVAMRGYYPRGGGLVRVRVEEPAKWRPLQLPSRGGITQIAGRAHASNLPEDVVGRMKSSALSELSNFMNVRIHSEILGTDRAAGPGGALVLWAETPETILGASGLAEKGKRAERVGREAAIGLLGEMDSRATLDLHASDQILAYTALATGPSEFVVREVTDHARTMMWLLSSFEGTKFHIASEGGLQRVTVTPKARTR